MLSTDKPYLRLIMTSTPSSPLSLALLSPFHGGSHRYWAEHYMRHSEYDWDLYSLPDKYWKWRMYGAAIHLARQLNTSGKTYHGIMTTDLLDVGLLKSLLDERYRDLPILVYFHENQLTYPWSPTDADTQTGRDHHYGFVNYTSALVSERLVFNSEYHRESFTRAASDLLGKMPDYRSMATIDEIKSKSAVVGIGVEQPEDQVGRAQMPNQTTPRILWNHRWEYDKNPTLFFDTLVSLSEQGVQFELVILGSATSKVPDIFKSSMEKLAGRIIHSGYLDSKDDYNQMLQSCTHLPVTSNQDFFGISAVEAIAQGCIPLLPKRLAFVEHLDPSLYPHYFYTSEEEYLTKLSQQLTAPPQSLDDRLALQSEMHKYHWSEIAPRLDRELSVIVP